MNILLAIADSNKEYLRKISEELQGYSDLMIYVYTSADKLENAMENESFDVVMFDPDLSESRINFSRVKMPICLYSEEAENTSLYKECAHISKYQRISKIYKDMIRAYAEKAGYSYESDHAGKCQSYRYILLLEEAERLRLPLQSPVWQQKKERNLCF